LIAKNGSTISALKLSATALDSNKPWKGPGAPTVLTTLAVQAVSVPLGSGLSSFGVDEELLKRVERVYLIPGQGATDLKLFHLLEISGVRERIEWIRELRHAPTDVAAVYAVGTKR
jgi:hypothetical protein